MSWPDVTVDARRDGKVIASGTLDHVVGHPANAVLWVARQLVTLPRGQQGQLESVLHGGRPAE
jgi:2-keto-4-pentenoate hydratase